MKTQQEIQAELEKIIRQVKRNQKKAKTTAMKNFWEGYENGVGRAKEVLDQ